jgi:predicted DCC family thiol-disulfide oxidoreductase YuxK
MAVRPVAEATHLVLWDGECGMCRRFASWGESRDKARRLRFVPFQDAPSPPMTPELAEACAIAMHVACADGGMLRAGRATLFILNELGWHWTSRILGRPPLIWLVEIGYRVVARNRQVFSRVLFRREPG